MHIFCKGRLHVLKTPIVYVKSVFGFAFMLFYLTAELAEVRINPTLQEAKGNKSVTD